MKDTKRSNADLRDFQIKHLKQIFMTGIYNLSKVNLELNLVLFGAQKCQLYHVNV